MIQFEMSYSINLFPQAAISLFGFVLRSVQFLNSCSASSSDKFSHPVATKVLIPRDVKEAVSADKILLNSKIIVFVYTKALLLLQDIASKNYYTILYLIIVYAAYRKNAQE